MEVSSRTNYYDPPYLATKLKASFEKILTSGKSSRITIDEYIAENIKLEYQSLSSDVVMEKKEEEAKKASMKLKLSTTAPPYVGSPTARIKREKPNTSNIETRPTKHIIQDKHVPSQSPLERDRNEENASKSPTKTATSSEKKIPTSPSRDLTEKKLLRKSSSTISNEKRNTSKNSSFAQSTYSQENVSRRASNIRPSSNSSTSIRSSTSSVSNRSSRQRIKPQEKKTPKRSSCCLRSSRPSSSSFISMPEKGSRCNCDSRCPSTKALDAEGNIRITCCKKQQEQQQQQQQQAEEVPTRSPGRSPNRTVLQISSSGNLVPQPERQPKPKSPSQRQKESPSKVDSAEAAEKQDKQDSIVIPAKSKDSRMSVSDTQDSSSPKSMTSKFVGIKVKNAGETLSKSEFSEDELFGDDDIVPTETSGQRAVVPTSPKLSTSKLGEETVEDIMKKFADFKAHEKGSDDEIDSTPTKRKERRASVPKSPSKKSPQSASFSPKTSSPKSIESEMEETASAKSPHRIAEKLKDLMKELSELDLNDSNKTPVKSPERRVIISETPPKESLHRSPSSPKTSPSKSIEKKVKGTPKKSTEIESFEDESDDEYESALLETVVVSESSPVKSPRRSPTSPKPSTPKSTESEIKEITSPKSPRRAPTSPKPSTPKSPVSEIKEITSPKSPRRTPTSPKPSTPKSADQEIEEVTSPKSPRHSPASPKPSTPKSIETTMQESPSMKSPRVGVKIKDLMKELDDENSAKTSPSKSFQKKVKGTPEKDISEGELVDDEGDTMSEERTKRPVSVSKSPTKSLHRVPISPIPSVSKSIGTETQKTPSKKNLYHILSGPKPSILKFIEINVTNLTEASSEFDLCQDEIGDGSAPAKSSERELFEGRLDDENYSTSAKRTPTKSLHRVPISPKSSASKSGSTEMEGMPSTKSPHSIPSSPKLSASFVEKSASDIMEKSSELEAYVDAEGDDNDSGPAESTNRREGVYETPPKSLHRVTISPIPSGSKFAGTKIRSKKSPHNIGKKIKDIIKELSDFESLDDVSLVTGTEYLTAYSEYGTAEDDDEDVDHDNDRDDDKDDDNNDGIDDEIFHLIGISENEPQIIEEESFIVYRDPDQLQDSSKSDNAFTAAMYQKIKRSRAPKTSTPKK